MQVVKGEATVDPAFADKFARFKLSPDTPVILIDA